MALNWDLEVFDELPSTQDVCKARAAEGVREGLVIQALEQSAGKGRYGREWIGGEGNLAVSLILQPDCAARMVGQLSILIGVALAQTIGVQAKLKWPNDVLIDDQKCAGILIDSDLDGEKLNWLVIGIGVNTSSAPKMGCSLNTDRDEFLQKLLSNIGALYEQWREEGFERIRQQWIEASYQPGTMLNVGVFEDLDGYGNLIVRDDQGQSRTISAGDVYLEDKNYAAGD